MGNDRIKNSARNMMYGFLKYVVTIIFPFITRTILIYKLGIQYAGISTLFSSILQVLNLSELGFSTAVVYELYEPVAKNDTAKICALLSFFRKIYKICGCFILTMGFFITPFIKYLIGGSYPSDINIYIIFIILVINTALSYIACGYKSVVFSSNQRDDILSKASIISNFLMYSIQILSILVVSNYYLYTICMLVGTVSNNYIMHLYAKKMYPEFCCKGEIDKKDQKKLIKNVGALFGHQLDMVVINSADNIVISMFLGLNVLTIYNNYYYIMNAVLNILVIISNSFAGSIGNSIAVETKEKNYKNFIDFTYFIGTISSIGIILLFALYQDFMKLWMGESMMLGIKTVILISFSLYVRQFRRSLITYKIAAGIWKEDALKPYVACIFNLLVNILLIKDFGLDGVIISTLISFMIIEIPWEIIVFFRKYFKNGINEYLKVQFKIFFKAIVICFLMYRFSQRIIVNSFAKFILKASILAIITVILFIIISYKDDNFNYIIYKSKKLIGR